MRMLGAAPHGETLILLKEAFLKNVELGKLDSIFGSAWPVAVELNRIRAWTVYGILFLLFQLHAPISQRFFYYLDCHNIAGREFLRVDYRLECWQPDHKAFVPSVIILSVTFTLLFPLAILAELCRKRKILYTPMVASRLGFLYSTFNVGSEFWEIHEIFRKLVLTGILVF